MFASKLSDENSEKLYKVIVNLVYTSNMKARKRRKVLRLFKILIFSKDTSGRRDALIRILKLMGDKRSDHIYKVSLYYRYVD